MKIQNKNSKVTDDEHMPKNVNESMFSFTFYAIFCEFLYRAIKATNFLYAF